MKVTVYPEITVGLPATSLRTLMSSAPGLHSWKYSKRCKNSLPVALKVTSCNEEDSTNNMLSISSESEIIKLEEAPTLPNPLKARQPKRIAKPMTYGKTLSQIFCFSFLIFVFSFYSAGIVILITHRISSFISLIFNYNLSLVLYSNFFILISALVYK